MYQHPQLEAASCYSVWFVCRICEWRDAFCTLPVTERAAQQIACRESSLLQRLVYRVFLMKSFHYVCAVHCFSTRGSSVPQGTFGTVWRHFQLSQLGVGRHRHLTGGGCQTPHMCRTVPQQRAPGCQKFWCIYTAQTHVFSANSAERPVFLDGPLTHWLHSPLLGWHSGGVRKPRGH